MKAKYLIEKLQQMNPETEIKMHHKDGNNALFILQTVKDNSVAWLEDISDIDVNEEINAQIKHAKEINIPDSELYYNLTQLGFTKTDIYDHLPNDKYKKSFDEYLSRLDYFEDYYKCKGCPYHFSEINTCTKGEDDVPDNLKMKCKGE